MLSLISGHSRLNEYYHRKGIPNPDQPPDKQHPNCDDCKTTENVDHFLCHCNRFDFLRKDMRDSLSIIWPGFNRDHFFQIQFLLFPYLINETNGIDNHQISIKKGLEIWRRIIQFYHLSKRFDPTDIPAIIPDLESID